MKILLIIYRRKRKSCGKENIPPKRHQKPKTFRYIGDFSDEDMNDAIKAKKFRTLAIKTIEIQKKKMNTLRTASRRYKTKISTMKDLLVDLKKKQLISENAADIINVSTSKNNENIVAIYFFVLRLHCHQGVKKQVH